jgi:Iap family predicted aminopeptidase
METPLNFLKSIEFQHAQQRKSIILNQIKKIDKEFKSSITTQDFQHKNVIASNIVVSISGNSDKKIVFGAHYDIWPKSGGINDNGTAVFILLELIKYALSISDLEFSLDFVFFDLEETKQLGAKEYVRQANMSKIVSMINLDMCGIGDTIIFNDSSPSFPQLSIFIKNICIEKSIKYKILTILPPGDDIPFQEAGIFSISLAIVPEITIPTIERLAYITRSKGFSWIKIKNSVKFMVDMIKGVPMLNTMHSNTDTVDTISIESMKKVSQVIQKLLSEINLRAKKEEFTQEI